MNVTTELPSTPLTSSEFILRKRWKIVINIQSESNNGKFVDNHINLAGNYNLIKRKL